MENAPQADSPPAEVVQRLFPGGATAIYRYVDLLISQGVVRGLLGPREVSRIWSRHVLNCAVVAPAFGPDAEVCDIGSGAGLPGVVLALARPDLHLVLLEPLLRRTTFLDEVVEALGAPNVEVLRGRAEELAGRRSFDYVTARAVAPLGRLARWGLPLCRAGGELVAMKGATAADEVEGARAELERLGAGEISINRYGVDVVSPPTTVVRIQSTGIRPGRGRGKR